VDRPGKDIQMSADAIAEFDDAELLVIDHLCGSSAQSTTIAPSIASGMSTAAK
jgi:hypothetical protein